MPQLLENPAVVRQSFEVFAELKAKPFVKWVGGKRQLLSQFRDLYPKKFDSNTSVYHEPFVGGGAVFFDLLPRNAVLSDWNNELITTYQVIKNSVEDLIKELHSYPHYKEFFLALRAKDVAGLEPVEVAGRFIYLNRTCFNGLYRVNRSGRFNVPFGVYKNPKICDEENLRAVSVALRKVEILRSDYKGVLSRAKKGDFVYFDPPYYPVNRTSNFTSYTAEGFLEEEQIRLRDTFIELAKMGCFVMLSNSDTPFIRELYEGCFEGVRVYTVFAGRAINSNGLKRGKVSEVVVASY